MCGHAQPPGREGSPYTAPHCLSLIGRLWCTSYLPEPSMAGGGSIVTPAAGRSPEGIRSLSHSLWPLEGLKGLSSPELLALFQMWVQDSPLEGTSFCGGWGRGTLHLPDLRPAAWVLALGLICHPSLWHTVPIPRGRPFRALGDPQQVAPGEKHLPFPSALILSVSRARSMGQEAWTPGGL